MNPRTTVILLALLLAATLAVYTVHTHTAGIAPAPTNTATTEQPHKLFDLTGSDIASITVAPAAGQAFTLARKNLAWELTQPPAIPQPVPAEAFKANDLADAIASLASAGQVTGSETASTGVDSPRFSLTFTTRENATHRLDIGQPTGIGAGSYVRIDQQPAVQSATTDLADQLAKPIDTFRRTRLLEVADPDIHSVHIQYGTHTLTLTQSKPGSGSTPPEWLISEPIAMTADQSAASDLLFAISGLSATGYAKESDPASQILFRLNKPQLTVTFTSRPAPAEPTATAPTTQPDITTTLRFGGFTDVTDQNVYVSISNSPSIATVAATVLDSFRKTPWDLRDLRVLSVDPSRVKVIRIETQPLGRPSHTTTIERRPPSAATRPTTAPAPSKWVIATTQPADDARVNQLIAAFNPLHAVRYFTPPKTPTLLAATRPGSTAYSIVILIPPAPGVMTTTLSQRVHLQIVDDGPDAPIRAHYNGLDFEISRDLLDQIKADYSANALNPSIDAQFPPSPPSQ